MSLRESNPSPDDPVDRAMDALRRVPIPEGPSPEAVERTLAALRAAADEPVVIPVSRRRRIMLAMLKTAAVILAGAAGVGYFAGFPPTRATADFVEATVKLRDAQTLSLYETVKIGNLPNLPSSRLYYKSPGLLRNDIEMPGTPVTIMDMVHGTMLIINPGDRSATLMEQPAGQGAEAGRSRDNPADMIEDMRQLAQKDGEPLGEKEIGGIRVRGFRVKETNGETLVWVDPQKKIPVLVEMNGRSGDLDYHITFSDIRLDPPLDEAMFRMEPPAGYTLRKVNARLNMPFEEAVVRVLRNYTNLSGGQFPAKLNDFGDYAKLAERIKKAQAKKDESKKAETKTRIDPKVIEEAIAAAIVGASCEEYKGRYGYRPDGVKLGDAKAILFWYQPEGATRYKVVYGDLHIGEATAAELPAQP